MSVPIKPEPSRRATNLSIDAELLAAARKLSIDLSRAAEEGISLAVRRHRERRWLEGSRAVLNSSRDWVEKHGLPIARHRLFNGAMTSTDSRMAIFGWMFKRIRLIC